MNAAWTKELRTEHLRLACRAWDLSCDPAPELYRAGESFVYAARRANDKHTTVALRITHPKHRDVAALETELRWMSFVGERGVQVPKALHSVHGKLAEAVESGGFRWHVSALEWDPGRSFRSHDVCWEPTTIELWGWQLGRMQRLATEFGHRFPRFAWDEPEHHVLGPDFERRLPQYAPSARTLLKRVTAMSRSAQTFGLCHRDLHQGNLLCSGPQTLVCIDFDDLCQHYFVADLAVPLYSALLFEEFGEEDLKERAEAFARPFLRGFQAESPLTAADMDHLPTFFALRDFEMVSVLDLWGTPRVSRWFALPARHIAHGNPLAELPWRAWWATP